MLQAGLWGMLAASSLILGAVIAQRLAVPPEVLGRMMGFGAGTLVAALAYDLIPDTRVADLQIWLSFGIGSLVFYGLDSIIESRTGDSTGTGTSIALGALLDGIPESIVLGIGIAVRGSPSIGFLVAVFVSNIPESLSATTDLRAARTWKWIYLLWGSITLISAIASAVGFVVASHVTRVDGRYMQALAGGAVLTMLADSMMPEAFAKGGRPIALMTALGFTVAALVTTLE